MGNNERAVLVLKTLISERLLIIYTLECALADDEETWHEQYSLAVKDEIENHKLALQEYKEGLNKLKQ